MQNPLVTIKCVAYNEVAYIRRTLEGFVSQKTNFPFVALVHDDASTDGTDKIIEEYASRYPEIIRGLYEEPGNNLFSRHLLDKQMNEWVFETGCKYVAMCEGDDFWIDPYKLQKQVDYMETHPNCSLCYTNYKTANENGAVSEDARLHKDEQESYNFIRHLFNAGYIAPPTWVYRADISAKMGSYDDFTDDTLAMALDLFNYGDVHYIDEPTAVYTHRPESVAAQSDPKKCWKYLKGIFKTQIYYAEKYHCSDELIMKLKLQEYCHYLTSAIEAEDNAFISEAIDYFHQQGMEVKWMVENCKRYVGYHHQYEQILHSKAYRLGKFLLKPFKVFKKK